MCRCIDKKNDFLTPKVAVCFAVLQLVIQCQMSTLFLSPFQDWNHCSVYKSGVFCHKVAQEFFCGVKCPSATAAGFSLKDDDWLF